MHCLTILTLALACALSIASDDFLEEKAEAEPIAPMDRFLIFDIRGSPDNLAAAFSGLEVVYKFKVIGGRRFVVVTRNKAEELDAMYNFTAPPDTEVRVYPAELYGSYARSLEVKGINDGTRLIDLPDNDLLLVEYTIYGNGADSVGYREQMAQVAREYRAIAIDMNVRVFHHTARFPYQAFVFFSIPDVKLDRVYLAGSDVLGGPDNMRTVPYRIFNLREW